MYSSTTIDTKRVFSSFLLSLITLGLLVLSGEAGAAEKNPINEMQSGSLLIKVMPGSEYIQAPLVNTEVELEVSGIVSRAKVIQHFKNDSSDWVQGTYVFPLPDNSAVD
ncbi:MAG: VIT domain-containing protein, partial [Betaproteobacteria bacterium]